MYEKIDISEVNILVNMIDYTYKLNMTEQEKKEVEKELQKDFREEVEMTDIIEYVCLLINQREGRNND